MFAVLGCCYCLCTMGGESAAPGKSSFNILYKAGYIKLTIFLYFILYILFSILASTNGYSAITSPAPSAALSPYDQKMYEAMSTDFKKKSMKKVFEKIIEN